MARPEVCSAGICSDISMIWVWGLALDWPWLAESLEDRPRVLHAFREN